MIIIDAVGLPKVKQSIKGKLSYYNTAQLAPIELISLTTSEVAPDWLGRLPGNGSISYPEFSQDHNYHIRVWVSTIRPPYLSRVWRRIPSRLSEQGWYSSPADVEWESRDNMAVHLLAQQCFHFLSHSGQLGFLHYRNRRNTRANASTFADSWLQEFKIGGAPVSDRIALPLYMEHGWRR